MTPSTDPDERHSRIRLLPQVMTPSRRAADKDDKRGEEATSGQ